VLHYAKKFVLDPDHSIEYLRSTEGSSGNWSFEPQDMREEAAREMSKVLSTAANSLPTTDTLATTHTPNNLAATATDTTISVKSTSE
jgi:hypothetical protein